MSEEPAGLEDRIDQRTLIEGSAYNAKAGAVVLTEAGEPVYLRGKREWPDEDIGKPVAISGTLRRGHLFASDRTAEGRTRQGIAEPQWYLESDA